MNQLTNKLYQNIYSLSNKMLDSLYYDICFDDTDLNKYILISKIICNENTTPCKKTLDSLVEKTGIFCKKSYIPNMVDIIKDASIEFYMKNPECTPLPLWQIIRDKLSFQYKLKIDIKNIYVQKHILTSYINNNIKDTNPDLLVKIKPSKNNNKISIIQKSIKRDNFDPILSIKSFSKDLKDNNLKIKVKENIIHISDCDT